MSSPLYTAAPYPSLRFTYHQWETRCHCGDLGTQPVCACLCSRCYLRLKTTWSPSEREKQNDQWDGGSVIFSLGKRLRESLYPFTGASYSFLKCIKKRSFCCWAHINYLRIHLLFFSINRFNEEVKGICCFFWKKIGYLLCFVNTLCHTQPQINKMIGPI